MSSDLKEKLIEERELPEQLDVKPLNIFAQIGLLIYKNLILTIKNPKNLLFLIITPFLLSGFMGIFQALARDNSEKTLPNPAVRPLPAFPHCIGDGCVSLDYRLITSAEAANSPPSPWVTNSIEYIKAKANLKDQDIYHGSAITNVSSLESYYKGFAAKPNHTQIGLIFCDGYNVEQGQLKLSLFCNQTSRNSSNSSDPTAFTYYMVLNKTDSLSVIFYDLLVPLPIDPVAAALKVLVDNSILNYVQGEQIENMLDASQRMKFTTSQYPVGKNRYIQNYDIVTSIGAFYYMITPLFAFLFIQNEIVREKESKLRQGLNIFGASHAAYWISWFAIANLYALVGSISTFLAGLAFQFGFFNETPFYIIIFFLFYPFFLAMQMLSFFLSTLSPTLKAANAISYGIVLFAIVIESFVSDNTLLTFIFTEDASPLIVFLKYFLAFYPPFSYTKIFTNITSYSGYHFDFAQRKWITGFEEYSVDVFSSTVRGKLPFGDGTFLRYSDLASMLILFGDCAFYIILTWYFDHVVSSNRGKGESPLFPFKKLYHCLCGKRIAMRKINPETGMMPKNENYLITDEEESARKERKRVIKNSKNKIPAYGLRMRDLSKTFKKMCSSNTVQAIKKFNLEIEPNELMGILGHNGAGKTTLINILTGVLAPDDNPETEIIINGNSIDKIDQIRKYIGVCSQFDILWNQLTAQEHLYMFARLKNVKKQLIDDKIDEMLGFVNLPREKNNKIKSFSGGMKRRLSLAIAAIGNPKIILLDEPTTGLDPKVRQQVWKLIEKLKVNKSIILTTHSMEEADILADRISVMVKGKLKCVGTSFYLKRTYGDGHRLTLNIENQKSHEVMSIIKKMFPEAIEVDCKGGNLIVGMNNFDDLMAMVRKLQSEESLGLDEYSLKKSIKDWNVSHSTLEEVFMKVSKEKED